MIGQKLLAKREVVVAQLVERLLPIPEVWSSNPVIGKNLFISNIYLLSTVYWKGENKEKEAVKKEENKHKNVISVKCHVGKLSLQLKKFQFEHKMLVLMK